MYTIDQFVEAMENAMKIAKNLEGIRTIDWNLHYSGRTDKVEELVGKMTEMMNEVNGNGEGTVEAA